MKRVIVVEQYSQPRDQGGGTRHVDLFDRVEGWEASFIASNVSHYTGKPYTTTDRRFILVPIPVYSGNGVMRMLGWGIFAAQATVVGCTRPADAVYGSSPQLLSALAGLLIARLKGVPFVMEVRDLWPESIVAMGHLEEGSVVHRMLVALEGYLYRGASRIVVVTPGWEDHFEAFGVDRSRVIAVPNGTEASDFEVTQSRDELRRRYGISGYTAVYAGAHGPANRVDLTMDAAEALPDVNFLMIGSGARKQWAIDEARRRGLGNIEFRDPIPKSELPGLLRACDVGLHVIAPLKVLDKGMSPNKLFDYLAAGLPVVSNARYPLRRVAADGEVGAMVGPEELVEGITRVRSADEATRVRWAGNAAALLDRFSRTNAAKSLGEALDAAVAKSPRRRGALPFVGAVLGVVAAAGVGWRFWRG
ncbi:glycosyltransferase family 4 protein [Tessaracoccus sp. MC1679]|uniref:glycosyltransferase family 4 protein n=1 Tax=Tessaracoccus sp. MC1679 TaxID=2760313 RepID=UPI0016036D96|nr:glycosyltransferase family 4 protein [Tessaracoccus sp. MC1679]